MVKSKKNKREIKTSDIIKGLKIGFALFMVSKIFTPLLDYKIYFDWWAQGDGNKYKGCVDLVSLAYYQEFKLYFYIRQLFISGMSSITSQAWVIFITSLIKGKANTLVPGGILTPKMICETLVPDIPMSNGRQWPATDSGWRQLFKEWGVAPIDKGTDTSYNARLWKNVDNFLYQQFSIPGDSVLIKGYILGIDKDKNGVTLYKTALEPLLGTKADPASGGWWGFLQGVGDKLSYNDIWNIVWAEDLPLFMTTDGPKNKCGSTSSIMSNTMAGVGPAIGVAMIAAGPAGPVIAAGVAMGAFIGSFFISMGSKGCL